MRLRELFTDDVVMDSTASGGSALTGADTVIDFLREAIGDVVTVHHGHMPEIELTSPVRATGVWAMEDMLRWPNGAPAARLRPLPRDVRQSRRGVAHRDPHTDPPAHGLHRARLGGTRLAVALGAVACPSRSATLMAGTAAARGKRMSEQELDENLQEFLEIRRPGIDYAEHTKDDFALQIGVDLENYKKFPRSTTT